MTLPVIITHVRWNYEDNYVVVYDSRPDRCYDTFYVLGPPRYCYPLPAIPLRVVYPPMGYTDMIYIDSLQHGEDDPVMRCCWDFYLPKDDPWYGKYQPTYTDAECEEILAIEEDHSNSCKCEVCRAWGA